jgi:hypothetical protein
MLIRLKNSIGMVKECKVGFSWTTFFFGCFPAFFRGDWKWGLIQAGLNLCTCGLSSFVFCFMYNKLYINDLLKQGYTPISDSDKSILISRNFISLDA